MFKIGLDDITFIGDDLARPECVLATASGDIYVSDRRGGVVHLAADGARTFIAATGAPDDFLPNGIALLPGRDLLIANLGMSGGVWRMRPDGAVTPVLREIDGYRLPSTNFVGIDARGRTWISISTRLEPRERAFRKGQADGFVAVMDDRGTRIVADGIGYTNEAIVDPSGAWLYVNETIGRRTSRFRIRDDGGLGPAEVVADYPAATFPDGLAFDAEGGVWIVSVASNRVIRVAPDGTQHMIIEDAEPDRLAEVEAAYQAHRFGRNEIDAGRSRTLANVSSLAFSGPDLKTVVLGSLHGTRLATFRSPIAGAPPVHWRF